MTALSQDDGCDFSFLKKMLDTSDGNLSTHIAKLESVGYLNITKTFKGKLPNTSYSLTSSGEYELTKYLTAMRHLILKAEKSK